MRSRIQRGIVITADVPGLEHEKYFVIMGYDSTPGEALGFFISSPQKRVAIARKNLIVQDYQLVVEQKTHPFLKYDSILNCFSYADLDFSDLVNGLIESPSKIRGNLTTDMMAKVEEAIETNPAFSRDERNLLIGPVVFPQF